MKWLYLKFQNPHSTIFFSLSLLGTIFTQFLVLHEEQGVDITLFITYTGLLLTVFNSYTSSISAKYAFEPQLFSYHLNFRAIILFPILIFTYFCFSNRIYILSVLVAFFNIDFLVPYLSRTRKFYYSLMVTRLLGIVFFVFYKDVNIYIGYLGLVFPTFLLILFSFNYYLVKPRGRFYNVVTSIVIISYTQLNYFTNASDFVDLAKFGLFDRSINLIVPYLFSLRLSKAMTNLKVMLLIFGATLLIPFLIDSFVYDSVFDIRYYFFLGMGILSGYVNAKAIYWLNVRSQEGFVLIIILCYCLIQILIKQFTGDLVYIYIFFYGAVLIIMLHTKKIYRIWKSRKFLHKLNN